MTGRRLIDELMNAPREKETEAMLQHRGDHIITSACSLLDDIERTYGTEVAQLMQKRLISGVKNHDSNKFRFTKR